MSEQDDKDLAAFEEWWAKAPDLTPQIIDRDTVRDAYLAGLAHGRAESHADTPEPPRTLHDMLDAERGGDDWRATEHDLGTFLGVDPSSEDMALAGYVEDRAASVLEGLRGELATSRAKTMRWQDHCVEIAKARNNAQEKLAAAEKRAEEVEDRLCSAAADRDRYRAAWEEMFRLVHGLWADDPAAEKACGAMAEIAKKHGLSQDAERAADASRADDAGAVCTHARVDVTKDCALGCDAARDEPQPPELRAGQVWDLVEGTYTGPRMLAIFAIYPDGKTCQVLDNRSEYGLYCWSAESVRDWIERNNARLVAGPGASNGTEADR